MSEPTRPWFAVTRDFWDHPLFADEVVTRGIAFQLCVGKYARFDDEPSMGLKRGQFRATCPDLARRWGKPWNKDKVLTFMRRLEREGMIEMELEAARTLLFTVANYDKYQPKTPRESHARVTRESRDAHASLSNDSEHLRNFPRESHARVTRESRDAHAYIKDTKTRRHGEGGAGAPAPADLVDVDTFPTRPWDDLRGEFIHLVSEHTMGVVAPASGAELAAWRSVVQRLLEKVPPSAISAAIEAYVLDRGGKGKVPTLRFMTQDLPQWIGKGAEHASPLDWGPKLQDQHITAGSYLAAWHDCPDVPLTQDRWRQLDDETKNRLMEVL